MARKAAVDDDGIDGQKVAAATFRWRCVDVARLVVALAVTAVMVVVTAHAIRVLVRPDDLLLRVNGGVVKLLEQGGTSPANMTFDLTLEAANPSGRVTIYYENIQAYLYGKPNNVTTANYFAAIPVKTPIALTEQSTEFRFLEPKVFQGLPQKYLDMYKPHIDLFSAGKAIPDGVVVVNGTLTIGLNSWDNKTSRVALYYCSPVAIGSGEDSSSDNTAVAGGGAQCTTYPPTPQVRSQLLSS